MSEDEQLALRKERSQRRAERRAREILHIAWTGEAQQFHVWGGEDMHIVEQLGTEIVCDCRGFGDNFISYCSHIAKYNLVINHREGHLENKPS
jgi:hypothetical protein